MNPIRAGLATLVLSVVVACVVTEVLLVLLAVDAEDRRTRLLYATSAAAFPSIAVTGCTALIQLL